MKRSKTPKPALTAAEVEMRLAERYSGQEWAFFLQVPSTTGGAMRTADAIAVSVWPSRGFYFIGFEIKVTRVDWLRELKNPEKADLIAEYCHEWYIVLGDESILQPGELPAAWGLIVPHGKTLRVQKEAPHREATVLSYGFVASLLRRAARVQRSGARDEAEIRRKIEEAKAAVEERDSHNAQRYKDEVDRLNEQIRIFEEHSGIRIQYAPPKSLIEDARLIKAITESRFNLRQSMYQLASLERSASRFYEDVKAQVRNIREDTQDFIEDTTPASDSEDSEVLADPLFS